MTRHRTSEELYGSRTCSCARCKGNVAGWAAVLAFALLYGAVLKPCFGDFLGLETRQVVHLW